MNAATVIRHDGHPAGETMGVYSAAVDLAPEFAAWKQRLNERV